MSVTEYVVAAGMISAFVALVYWLWKVSNGPDYYD
jgi:hypothetical protein